MTSRLTTRAAALVLITLAGCGPRMIGQTQIEDTEDNRQILDLLHKYRLAYEAKDAAGITALASERYLDARDSISYETLRDDLTKTFDRVKQLQLELTVRRVRLDGDRAEVDYFYSTSFQLVGAQNDAWTTESDDKRMSLVRENGAWKVVSGL